MEHHQEESVPIFFTEENFCLSPQSDIHKN